MNQPEKNLSSADPLMMGPDGEGSGCFSYLADVPLGIRNRNAAQRALRDLRRMPDAGCCFSYSADVPLGIRDRNAAQRALRDLRRMPEGSGCFSY